MIATDTKRPRNVDAPRAAAILYGDWGTSKAYVIGLAFAISGYSSFWLVAAMCALAALVGINYIVICRHHPDGGGVYASVRHRSQIISIVGAFLLIADYIVTAAISSFSAFQYLGVAHPEKFAALAIAVVGALNYFGPKHTGGLAFLVAVPTAAVVLLLGAFSIPHLGEAVRNLQPLHHGFWSNWNGFVGVVLALSGVEAIANATGVMKLDPGSTHDKPSVSRTSTPAIIWVMIEVCMFTALLGLASHALGGLQLKNGDVNAPGHPGVRDYMLRYMGEVFVGSAFGPAAGQVAAWVVSIVFGVLLLSAVNTAIVDLIAILYLMSRDREVPAHFGKLNFFGVPTLAAVVATIVPLVLVVVVKDLTGLAELYAVGVVGAIATNLGASATDKKLGMRAWERVLMLFTCCVMVGIEISLFIDKPNARGFAATVLAVGLILRGLASERLQKKKKSVAGRETPAVAGAIGEGTEIETGSAAGDSPLLCAVRGIGKTLDFAIEEAKATRLPLYLLFVREQPVLTSADHQRKWQDDAEARRIFTHAKAKAAGHSIIPCYTVSDSTADTIVEFAATVGASRVIVGAPQRNALVNVLRGNLIRHVSKQLPENIHLLVYA